MRALRRILRRMSVCPVLPALSPPTMRWRVREGGPERRQLCDGGRFIAVESKEAELAALKISGISRPPHPSDPPPPLDRPVSGAVAGAAVNRAGLSEEAVEDPGGSSRRLPLGLSVCAMLQP